MATVIKFCIGKKTDSEEESGCEFTEGLFLKSPDETVWEIIIDNDGVLSTQEVV